jgi:hypothetical protein
MLSSSMNLRDFHQGGSSHAIVKEIMSTSRAILLFIRIGQLSFDDLFLCLAIEHGISCKSTARLKGITTHGLLVAPFLSEL